MDVCQGSNYASGIQFNIQFMRALWWSSKTDKVEYSLIIKALWIWIEMIKKFNLPG